MQVTERSIDAHLDRLGRLVTIGSLGSLCTLCSLVTLVALVAFSAYAAAGRRAACIRVAEQHVWQQDQKSQPGRRPIYLEI